MTENQERAEQARSEYYISGGTVQILPNATTGIQIVHQCDGTVTRTERRITPAESGLHESPAPPASATENEPPSLAMFIPDEVTRLVYETRLGACTDTVILCQTVLTDLYNEILTDFTDSRKLVKSRAFIVSLLPYLRFENGANIPNLRYGIRKYVLGEGG